MQFTEDRNSQLKNIIDSRGITRLLHFSDSRNQENIETFGFISRLVMHNSKWIENVHYHPNDNVRFENKLDYISLSITDPNLKLFYVFKQRKPGIRWIMYSIKPDIIFERDCYFYYTNAAWGGYKRTFPPFDDAVAQSPGAFGYIFSENLNTGQGQINRIFKRDDQPTCEQAEILVKGSIPPEYIKNREWI